MIKNAINNEIRNDATWDSTEGIFELMNVIAEVAKSISLLVSISKGIFSLIILIYTSIESLCFTKSAASDIKVPDKNIKGIKTIINAIKIVDPAATDFHLRKLFNLSYNGLNKNANIIDPNIAE